MATPILEQRHIELHTFFNVEAIDPARKMVISLEGEELGYDLLVLVPPHRGAKIVTDSGLAPGAGWLPTDRGTLQVKEIRPSSTPDAEVPRRPDMYAIGDATDLPLSKAGSTAHFESPIVAERVAAAIQGRTPDPKHGTYTGRVMCFFEIGDGKGTILRFDYLHPPKPPRPSRIWHLGKIIFNKTYWHTVPRGRV
jgi:sulfide:quinone oxidoreductase